jgi:hypothetical protein
VSEIKKIIHERGYSIKPEALDTLDRQIQNLILIAVSRAEEDRRKRIDCKDFIIDRIVEIKNKRGIQ